MMNFMRWNKRVRWIPCAVGVILISALAGCNRDGAKVYRIAKEDAPSSQPEPDMMPQPQASQPDMGSPSDAAPSLPALKYKLPTGWQEKPPSEMRVASFSVPGPDGQSADVSVIPLPVVGRDLELVNMWRSRVQLPATSDPDAVSQAKPVAIGAEQGRLFDFVSEKPIMGKSRQRLLVAMLTRDNMSWFFKITGEDECVTFQKKNFLQFLKSISFAQNGQTWFYKLMGDKQLVAQQKDAFTKFIQSANYANAR